MHHFQFVDFFKNIFRNRCQMLIVFVSLGQETNHLTKHKEMKQAKHNKKKEKNIPLELMTELHRCYDFFNNHFCEGKLPRVILLITQESKRRSAYGWFRGHGWNLQNEKISEIVLHEKSFKNTDEIFDTLLHEMAHLKNFIDHDNKVVDCSSTQRHNQIFKNTAEHFGLVVRKSKRFGFGHTSLGDVARTAIEKAKPNLDLFQLYANLQPDEDKKKNESKMTPTMVDRETKDLIKQTSEQTGLSQKEIVGSAVKLFVEMPNRIAAIADAIFEQEFQTREDLINIITTVFAENN